MIRPVTPEDTPALIALAEASGLFGPGELEQLAAMLNDSSAESDDVWLTDDDNGPVGIAYVAPERMTEGTWNLYLIAIHPNRQRQGRGTSLLRHVEQFLVDRGERILIVETSGTSGFERTRAFYRSAGYHEEARIRDFYKEGDDKVVFRKALGGEPPEKGSGTLNNGP